jgi:hypothetical protein
MLTSHDKHPWSASPTGTFVAPSAGHLGGSSGASFTPGDGRQYIAFWGGGSPEAGCCHDTSNRTTGSTDTAAWQKLFELYVR